MAALFRASYSYAKVVARPLKERAVATVRGLRLRQRPPVSPSPR